VYFRITRDVVELVEPQNVSAFHVTCPPDLDDSGLAGRIHDAALGELLPDDHVMVSVDAVRRYAKDRVGPTWEQDLAGMVAYAAGKGWTDDTGTQIRAHIERT
jgi:hypothetical protein